MNSFIQIHDPNGKPAYFNVSTIEYVCEAPEDADGKSVIQTTSRQLFVVQETYEDLLKLMQGTDSIKPDLIKALTEVHDRPKRKRKTDEEVRKPEDND